MGRAWWGWLHGQGMENLTAQMVSSPQKQRGPQRTGGHPHKGTPPSLLLAQCPQPLTPLSHLLILVHHAFATGVKEAEGAQDGLFRVCPWEAKGAR